MCCLSRSLLVAYLADEGEAIAEGENKGFHSWVSGHLVVESANALGLGVHAFGFHHVSIPKGVVG